MQEFRNKIASICCFNVKRDPVLQGFRKLFGESAEESFEGYSEIAGTVLKSGKPLAEYFHDMLVFSESPVLNEFAFGDVSKADLSCLRKDALRYDLEVLRSLCEETAAQIQIRLNTFYDTLDFGKLPLYDNGVFNYTLDYFLDYVRTHGSGMFARYKAFTFDGELHPIDFPDTIKLSDLKNYEEQRKQVVDNTVCFLSGKPAQNVLLYGDRGTGKSSTVKAVLNESKYLRMVEVLKNDIELIPQLFRKLREIPLHFIVLIDDLSFSENDDRFGILKGILEGSLAAKPDNILIYATTNRRKIIRETIADREVSGADAIDESMSLSDRFGLFVTFMKPDKRVYLDIVQKLAEDKRLEIPEEKLFAAAERFALKRGGRSPRTARQFVDWVDGRLALGLDI